jgi:4-amino-4-deoxy-L-arabinose transferase-like glycosyltransferase
MIHRADFISLWWPGSPREGAVFQSKPVLSFWLMSLCLRLFGLGSGTPGEMALGHGAEWALRIPFCALAALSLGAIYYLGARLASRRAGLLAALVAATCPLYALVARQAMTDFAFVAPMTGALACAALALFDDDGPPGRLRWATLGLVVLAAAPQLAVDSVALRVRVGGLLMYGVVAMLPYLLGLAGLVVAVVRARRRAPLWLMAGGALCGLAVLGKGLAGVALPVVILIGFLVASGSWRLLLERRLIGPLCLALLATAVVAVPWHHAMILRHGWVWWNELFGDNQWRRLMIGRWGDRGTFEYFLRELGYGTLPWLALLPAALALATRRDEDRRRRALVWLGAVWAVGAYAVVSVSMTKFHHYVLPAVPGLALVLGCALDDWWAGRSRPAAVVLAGLPLVILVMVDLVASPSAAQRFLWLFSYDYVYNPAGRHWPAALDFRPLLVAFGVAFSAGALALAWRRRAAVVALGAVAVLFTFFLIDRFMPAVAPYWSQKGTIATYYQQRRSPDEKLLAYRVFWRGENFYTSNAIYEGPPDERTVFDSPGEVAPVDEALRRWIDRHRGGRQFFLVDPGQGPHLLSLLPAEAQASWRVIAQPNDKFILAAADL